MLHGRLTLPKRTEWLSMLDRVNAGAAYSKPEWLACNSSNPQLHAYPCSVRPEPPRRHNAPAPTD